MKLIEIDGRKRVHFPAALYLIFLLFLTPATAQFHNAGSIINISDGTSVICLGNVTNLNGSISNNGKLEVGGNFSDSGSYHSDHNDDSLLLIGTGSVTLRTGSAPISNLFINKTGDGSVTLAANARIGSNFTLIAGGFSTDPSTSFELVAPATATFTFGSNKEITGKIRRTNWINGSRITFHRPEMSVMTNGGTVPASLLVDMRPGRTPTLSDKAVKRFFYFSPEGGNSYTADITFPYSTSELNTNSEENLAPWHLLPLNKWNGKFTGNTINTVSNYVSSGGIEAGIFANSEWKLSDVAISLGSLFVYPVPARNTLNIGYTVEKNCKAIIKLSDISGRVYQVHEKSMAKGFNRLCLNITGLSTGQYILKVEEGNSHQTKVVLIN